MSEANKGATTGGQDGPSDSGIPAIESIAQISSHLARVAVGRDGKLHANAEIQIALRDKDGRSKILEQLIREVCPDGVSGAQWRAWLVGGRSPFDVQPKKAAPGKERPSQTLVRSSNRVRGQEKKVDRLRSDLLEAEEELRFVKAYENAAVHWHVVDQLIEIMSPAFAMGPAWTLMRSLSAHVSDEEADKATDIFVGAEKIESMARYRQIRARETGEMFDALDWFSGHRAFEEAMRTAVLKVCKDFEPRRDEAGADGRRPRSERAMRTSAHPKAQQDADEILEGLPTE